MSQIQTLEQLKMLTHAFDSFVSVKDSNLPEYYKGIFPTHCECGSEVIMTIDSDDQYGYTQLQCCNPDCWIKMAHRFSYFAKALGFKGFGSTGALPLYRELHHKFAFPSFLYIFKLDTSDIRLINGDAYGANFEDMKSQLATRVFQFKDAIVALGIPDIGKNCAIFDVVKSPRDFLNIVLKKKLEEVCKMSGIYAPKTYYYLDMARVDIVTLLGEIMPHVVSTPKREVHVAITGSVSVEGQSLTRAEFIWKCESILDSGGEQAYKLIETKAESKLDYVIADTPSNSSKYRLGKKLGKLIAANEFYSLLKSNLGGEENGQ